MDKFMEFLQSTMETPALYGWYHILCLALVVAAGVILGITFKKASEKKVRIFLIVFSSVMILLEIYKQVIFSYDNGTWDYQWYAFPFQFCSTPMYVCLLAGIIKNGKVRESLLSFLATFSLFGGLIVMLYPGDVFMSYIGINIQTMVHHGGMVLIGIVLHASGSVKHEHKTILKAMCTFGALVALALIGNCIYVWAGGTETMNLFFISPYFPCTLPVFSMIYSAVPYIVFLALYVIGFSLAAYLVLLSVIGIKKLIKIRNSKKAAKETV